MASPLQAARKNKDSDGGGVPDVDELEDKTHVFNPADDLSRGAKIKHALPQTQEVNEPNEGKVASEAGGRALSQADRGKLVGTQLGSMGSAGLLASIRTRGT